MVTLVWRTDVHLAVEPPQSRLDDWADTVLGKLGQVGDIARQVGAAAVLDGGDFFHIKMPSRTTHELVQRVGDAHRRYPCPVFGNVGNHDVKYGDLRFLGEAPLGVLFGTGVFERCYDEHEVFFGPATGNSPGVGIYRFHRTQGWLNGNPFAVRNPLIPIVRVVGIPYHGSTYDMNRFTAITKGEEDYLVVMAHVLASHTGGTMFQKEDIVRYSDIVNLDPDVWMFGHWHKNQGVTEVGGKFIVNVGSLTRGALNEDEVTRVPECVVLRFGSNIQIERRPLAVQPANEVFDIVGRTRQEAKAMTVDAFVESITKALTTNARLPLLDEVRALPDLPDPVRERLIDYLERAGA